MFRLAAFGANPEEELHTLIRATRAELITLTTEYHITPPHGVTKAELHNLIIDHLADNDLITPEQQDQHRVTDKTTLTHMKLKIELAQLEAAADERKREMRRQEAELTRERDREQRQLQQQEAELQRAREQEQFRFYEQKAELERAREQERLHNLQHEAELQRQQADLQRQRQEQEAELQRLREVERLQILAQELELKRQQEEDGVGITLRLEQDRLDTALELRRQELELESTHLS
ncbi:uncharacterized protein F23F12.8-like [Procambarus clarkii]|uniref:uncharacterized protein F23F12.8-like n=1 Tax=Procambarus clarkii TaxID=6728 RepID=UPI003742ADE2